MGKYSCEKCAKTFSQKSHYDKHLTRKNPCEIQTDKIKALIDKAVEEKLIELNQKLILNNTENIISDSVEPVPNSVPPTQQEYELGFYVRYFLQYLF